MPEDIMDRLNRLANAGRKAPPKVESKKVFTMPTREEIPKPKNGGYLMGLLDEIDAKHRKVKSEPSNNRW